MDTTETLKVDYMDDKLVQDAGFRNHLLSEICKVCVLSLLLRLP